MTIIQRLLKAMGRDHEGDAPQRFIASIFLMSGHVCMLASLILLLANKHAPQQGELIKGAVMVGVLCYILGKYFQQKS